MSSKKKKNQNQNQSTCYLHITNPKKCNPTKVWKGDPKVIEVFLLVLALSEGPLQQMFTSPQIIKATVAS